MKKTMLCVALLVGGCASSGERDAVRCESYGFTPGTDAYASCRQQADLQRRQMLGNYLMMQSARPAPQTPFYPMPARAPTTTNCMALGNSLSCQSY